MTAEELDAIEARANAATPGPWVAVEHGAGEERWPADVRVGVAEGDTAATAAFIAAARADVPALVAEVRRLRAEIATLRCTTGCAGARGTACPDGACNRCCYTEHHGHDII